ncbi:MAG: ParB/RepB/Spo0J family partition protein [Ruminococcaceae bacterium]|nr:ParB/RepB/Spo0J family partition protein [Oscillospiraceae bacterium]
MAKKVLGKGFNSIFDDNSFDDDENISTLKITEIEPNKDQPRKSFDIESLKTLADSIRQNGIIQPLLVRSMNDGSYQIVAGERRWRAAKMAGLTEVPVFVKELTDKQTQQIALIENLQRENLNPIEEALGYKELIEKYDMTHEDVAKVVGKARASISNALRLLELPEAIKDLVENKDLSAGHAKVLLSVKDDKNVVDLAFKAATKEVSVRELERMVKNLDKPEKQEKPKDVFYSEAEISLSAALETAVRIVPGKKKNILEIEFYSNEDLSDIINRLAKK